MQKIIILSCVLSVCFYSRCVSAELLTEPLSAEREATIISALLNERWNDGQMGNGMPPLLPNALTGDQRKLWQGNTPKIDIGLSSIELEFVKGDEPRAAIVASIKVDTSASMLRLWHSRATSPRYRGGVLFVNGQKQYIDKVLILAADNTSLLVFMPYWRSGEDLHLLLCPRELEFSGSSNFTLVTKTLEPKKMLFRVDGRLRAKLFSGTGAGLIQAKIDRSLAVPPTREESDSARGINPVVDLVYQPRPEYLPVSFPESGRAAEGFSMTVDMRLPSGNKRKIVEGYSFWISQVDIPEAEVLVPVTTILETRASAGVSPELRANAGRAGLKAVVESGVCTLIVGERREAIGEFSDE